MRVVFVTYDFKEMGGQGRFSRGLVSALTNCGVETEIICPASTNLSWPSRAATRLGRNVAFSYLANLQLRSLLKDRGADLIHVNGGPGGVLIPVSHPVPVVYTAHHTYAQQARLIGGQGWKSLLAIVERKSYQAASTIAADTQSTADSLIREYGLTPANVSIIPCGLDFDLFRPTSTQKAPHTCLYVGRLDARKGFSHLVQAWKHVVARVQDSKLLVVGRGPERAAAEKFLLEEGMRDTVRFAGRVDTQELVRLYGEAQCVAVPSIFEGFGLAALEALACGTRVVARNVEGSRDVVTDPSHGSLVSKYDVLAFADAILQEFEQPRVVDVETRAKLTKEYDWAVIARQYLDLYESTLRTVPVRIAAAA